ncbi:MAG: ferredoxin family protein [Kiritimatiellae bacterium]|nr:ferredoxin family protein [Kiritimatiellia bacterium]
MSVRYQVKVLKIFCKGCGLCVNVCPQKLLVISQNVNKGGFHFPEQDKKSGKSCAGCKQCALICPEAAIEIFRIDEKKQKKA